MTAQRFDLTIQKRSAAGHPLTQWPGRVLERSARHILAECFFDFDLPGQYPDVRKGDRVLEWYFTQRWYNIMQFHDVSDGHLKGWYCNITRPSVFAETPDGPLVYWDDLALDVFVHPHGQLVILDADELAALHLPPNDIHQVWQAADELRALADGRHPPFHLITP